MKHLDAANVYNEPLDSNDITDEDSGKENGGIVDNLWG